MSETYLITAKTVEEAIAIANREYADQNHEVSYEILEMPKKGFPGIGAKDAKIKITVTKSVSAELDSLVSDIRGMKVMTSRGGEGKKQKPQSEKTVQKLQNQPKGDKPQSDKPAQPKQQKPQNDKPQSEKTVQKPAEKAPVKAEEPVRAEEVKSDIASKLDAAISSATTWRRWSPTRF